MTLGLTTVSHPGMTVALSGSLRRIDRAWLDSRVKDGGSVPVRTRPSHRTQTYNRWMDRTDAAVDTGF